MTNRQSNEKQSRYTIGIDYGTFAKRYYVLDTITGQRMTHSYYDKTFVTEWLRVNGSKG